MKTQRLSALLCAVLAITLTGCKSTTFVCDQCGIVFTASGDYSETQARDKELNEMLGVDMYDVFCFDCFSEIFKGRAKYAPIVAHAIDTDDRDAIQAYDDAKAKVKNK